jgi:hypothetical protein
VRDLITNETALRSAADDARAQRDAIREKRSHHQRQAAELGEREKAASMTEAEAARRLNAASERANLAAAAKAFVAAARATNSSVAAIVDGLPEWNADEEKSAKGRVVLAARDMYANADAAARALQVLVPGINKLRSRIDPDVEAQLRDVLAELGEEVDMRAVRGILAMTNHPAGLTQETPRFPFDSLTFGAKIAADLSELAPVPFTPGGLTAPPQPSERRVPLHG